MIITSYLYITGNIVNSKSNSSNALTHVHLYEHAETRMARSTCTSCNVFGNKMVVWSEKATTESYYSNFKFVENVLNSSFTGCLLVFSLPLRNSLRVDKQ